MGKSQKNKNTNKPNNRPSIINRRARFEYSIIDTVVAGIILTGTEVKSIREGHGQLASAFARIDKKSNEINLYGMIISEYQHAGPNNHQIDRTRKLLLNKREIDRWRARVEQEQLTIIPTKLFFRKSLIKIELGLAKRKQKHDKREDIKKRDLDRAMKQRY